MGRVRQVAKETAKTLDIPEPPKRIMRIREYTRKIDIVEEWEVIKAWLAAQYKDIDGLKDLVRQSADMSRRARDIYAEAKIEYEKYEIRFRDRIQIWKKESIQYWEAEKEAGLSKQITNDMIEDVIIEYHSELYQELKGNLIELKETCASLKSLEKKVENRGHDLRKLLDSENRKPGHTPKWMNGQESNG